MTVFALRSMRLGDWLVLAVAAMFTTWLTLVCWQGGAAEKAIIRSGGKIYREVTLGQNQTINVPGPLGVSTITIQNHQARITSDPSPRQYCVRQGWLSQMGEAAICLPNQISVELTGARRQYDSLSY